jgi:glutathione S-transferase
MKLYYATGACSLSPHIVLHEAGLSFTAVKVNTKTHQLSDGTDYYSINPLGYVPLLELEDGTRLSETPAIVQYIADLVPDKQLAPANGSLARYQVQSWLNLIGTELHRGFAPLFNPATPADYRPQVIERLLTRLAWVDQQLDGRAYLMGEEFNVADTYLFVVTSWAKLVKVDIAHLAHIAAFRQRMSERPGVQAALKAEGLLR